MRSLSRCFLRPLHLRPMRPLLSVTPQRAKSYPLASAVAFEEMIDSVKPIVSQYLAASETTDSRVTSHLSFDELSKTLSVDRILEFTDGLSKKELLREVSCILEHSVRSGHPLWCDKLYSGSEPIGQMAALLTAVINNNTHTFKAGPSLQVIEAKMIAVLNRLFFDGLSPAELDTCDGTFVPGGSYANLMAARIALNLVFPEAKTDGILSLKSTPVILASDQFHYSITTNAETMGIGSKNVISLKTHPTNGQIDVDNLRRELSALKADESRTPIMVSTMAASTVLGAFDDFEALSFVCRDFGVLLHVDACYGGAAVFGRSEACRKLVRGIHLADVISFDAHKTLSVPLLCSAVLVKNGVSELPSACGPLGAEYLFHGGKRLENSQKTMQCSRVADALKLYLTLLYYGTDGIGQRVDDGMRNARLLFEMVNLDEDFFALHTSENPPMYCNVAFWFVGDGSGVSETGKALLRQWREDGFALDSAVKSHVEFEELLRTLEASTKRIHDVIAAGGKALLDFAPLKAYGIPSFIRPVTHNPRLSAELLQRLLQIIKDAAVY